MLPRHLRYEAAERALAAQHEHQAIVNEDSNSNSQDKWGDYYM